MNAMRTEIARVAAGTLALAAASAALPVVLDAVLVAPHAVFIDHRSRTGQVFLVNTGDQPEEVSIDVRYGYPATDSLGGIGVRLFDEVPAGEPSAASWIRVFPRTVRVEPGQRQVVRLLANPPAGLPDGEYWTRLIVTSRGAGGPAAAGDSAIQAGVVLEIQTIISVTYRKGQVTTGVQLNDVTAVVERDSIISWMNVARAGSAAYLGTARYVLRDADRNEVSRWETPIAIYHALNRRFAFPLDSIAPGDYLLDFSIDTGRDDLDDGDVLPAEPVSRTFQVRVGS